MPEPPPTDDNPVAAFVVGVIYLTFCSAAGSGLFLFWHPESIYCRAALAVGATVGLIVALAARIKDPAKQPIRWGLLWLAIGFVSGPCLVFGTAWLLFR